jgi:hypothetical protein
MMNEEREDQSSTSSLIAAPTSSLIPHPSSFRRWRLAILVASALALVALLPQLNFRLVRGREWRGEYFMAYSDEVAYSAYVNALAEGHTRRTDAYAARDDTTDAPLPESLYSVQLLPAYAVALPARLLHLSTSTAFILLPPLVAFFAALAVFRLVLSLTDDERLAALAVPTVLCLGVAVDAQGAARFLLNLRPPVYVYLPFLRRYQPAVAFPLLFVFPLLIRRALACATRRETITRALAAGLIFAALVFSYYYLWTGALAWLICLTIFWLIARPGDRRRLFETLIPYALCATCALAPYFYLLAQRAAASDDMQALAHTHAPDLARRPELFGLLIGLFLIIIARRGLVSLREPATLFALAFTFAPVVVFNQQIITGRSLQPLHYELYVANYFALLAAVVAAWLAWRGRVERRVERRDAHATDPTTSAKKVFVVPKKVFIIVSLLAFAWGAVESEVWYEHYARLNIQRDEARAANLRLAQLADEFARDGNAQTDDDQSRASQAINAHAVATTTRPIVFCADPVEADSLPTATSHAAVLWSIYMLSAPALTPAEYGERLRLQMYYTGVAPARFDAMLHNDLRFQQFVFGWARVNARLSANFRPVTAAETQSESDAYASFVSTFTHERAARLPLSFAVVRDDSQVDLSNLARWYTLAASERAGAYTIYRLKLKD